MMTNDDKAENQPTRYALVDSKSRTIGEIKNYLPRNYDVTRIGEQGAFIIHGRDDHGWTLDGYVLPRLGSGLIAAHELTRANQ